MQNDIQCSAQHMATGGNSSRWNHESRASEELFKMLVIKLGLVIKIRTRENMKAGAYAQEVKVWEN